MITHPEVENAPRTETVEATQAEAPIAREDEQRWAASVPSLPPLSTITPRSGLGHTQLATDVPQPELTASPVGSKPRVRLLTIGVALIAIGALALVATIFQSTLAGLLVLPALGAMFLAWGFAVHESGPLIPGGILTGLGLGALISQNLPIAPSGEMAGAIVVTGLALGFLAIAPLTWMVSGHAHYWALFPGAFLALVAVSLYVNSTTVLSFMGTYLWPVAVVGLGVFLLWRAYRPRSERPPR
jgi:hypothetical protein